MEVNWYLFGAGGLGREVCDTIIERKDFDGNLIFLDDSKTGLCLDLPIMHPEDIHSGGFFTICIGEPKTRKLLFNRLIKKGLEPRSAISIHAIVSKSASVGAGCYISNGVQINSGSRIKENCIINPLAVIGHDVSIESSSVVSSHTSIGGNSSIGSEVFIGMGAQIKEKCAVGNRSIVGMGASVFRSVESDLVVLGNPARVVSKTSSSGVFG